MKRCPTCNRIYSDETLSYCLMDGSVLLDDSTAEVTQRIPAARITDLPRTEILQAAAPRETQGTQASTSPLLIYIIIALLALIVGGLAVAWLKSGGRETAKETSQAQAPVASSNSTPRPEAERAAPTNTDANNAASALTEDAVRDLIERWRVAQNSGDFAAYQSCYDVSFQGVKRTATGREVYYDYAGWMRDRRRMAVEAVGLNIEVKYTGISISGDTAQVEFEQYYRSRRYSDYGPKVMKVRRTGIGDRIVYEDLKSSRPL